MSTLGGVRTRRPAAIRPPAGGNSARKATFAGYLGFHPAATPLIVLLGLVFLMATVPQLFKVLSTVQIGPDYLHAGLDYLRDTAARWSGALGRWSTGTTGRVAMHAGLVAIPALWLAAAVRAVRVRTWKPLLVTAIATTLGVIGIPIATWIAAIAVFLWRIIGYIAHFIGMIFPWLARITLWVGAAVLAIALVVLAASTTFRLVTYLTREKRWLRGALLSLFAGALVGASALGWFDALYEWLGALVHFVAVWIDRIAGWIGAVLIPVVRFVVRVVLLVVAFLLIAGIAVGGLGQAGRTVYLPFTSAFKAGHDQGRCADLAAGAGVSMSLTLTGATLDSEFARQFGSVWSQTPLVSGLPVPVDGFGFLLPGAAERFMSPAFVGYAPIVDLAVLVLVATVGVGSLLFVAPAWADEYGSRIAIPVLLAVGAAIALALPLIVVAAWLREHDT